MVRERRLSFGAAVSVLLVTIGAAQAAPSAPPRVVVLDLNGSIQPATLRYLVRGLDEAEQANAQLVVLQLDTPGGLLVSLRSMTQAIVASRTPVAVFVAPAGARAASAGFFLMMAADIAAMAPGTNAGAAHPVGVGGSEGGGISMGKATEDAAALIRSLAERRGRMVEFAEDAVRRSRSFSASEALKNELIDRTALDLPSLLRQLDGASVRRFDGRTQTLRLTHAAITRITPTLAERLLIVLADPQIAYVLLMAGLFGLVVELFHPGAFLPGIFGTISLLLAFYGFSVLPVSWSGALLILLGITLFVVEAFVTSHGFLALAGIASFVAGSAMLVDSPIPALRVGLPVVIPTAVIMAVVTVFVVWNAVRLRSARPRSGLEGMVGEAAEVVTAIAEQQPGKVFVHGEYWNAVASESLAEGATVRVEAIDGSRLRVASMPANELRPHAGPGDSS